MRQNVYKFGGVYILIGTGTIHRSTSLRPQDLEDI